MTDQSVVLFVDTFSRYFEPHIARDAETVLQAGAFDVLYVPPNDGGRPLCCGRTFLNAGMVEEASAEAERTVGALAPFAERGAPIVGLEPSCILTLRDEFVALSPDDRTHAVANSAFTFEEFLSREHDKGKFTLDLKPTRTKALVHGHCHQKAFGVATHVNTVLDWIPELDVESITSGCCGMAGSFGYEARHYDISMKMAELDLLPQIRAASRDSFIVADGTSCRAQIEHGTGTIAQHAASVLASALS